MGNIIPGFDLESIINNKQVKEIDEEATPDYILREIEKFNKKQDPKLNSLYDYFKSLVKSSLLRPFSNFKKKYRIKKNFPITKDLIFNIYTIENKMSRKLYNLKLLNINLKEIESNHLLPILETEKDLITNNISILQKICSPNIENILDFYIEKVKGNLIIMIISTYTSFKTLLDDMNEKIEKFERYTDLEFKIIFKTILDILNDLKCYNIVHRGITPNAFYFQKEGDYSSLTLKNFYFSTLVKDNPPRGICGSLWYSAPEILRDIEHDFKCDVWSAGLVLYQTLTLENPFQEHCKKEDILSAIDNFYFHIHFKKLINLKYDKNIIDILKDMLIESRNGRKSLDDLLSNKKIKALREEISIHIIKETNLIFNINPNEKILREIAKNPLIKNSKNMELIIHIFFNIKHILLDDNQLIKLNTIFNYFDINNNNTVTSDEFRDRLFTLRNNLLNIDLDITTIGNPLNQTKLSDNRNKIKFDDYTDIYKICMENLLQNDYMKSKSESPEQKKFDFEDFCVLSLILNFYEEKRKKLIINNNKLDKTVMSVNMGEDENSHEINENKLNPVFNLIFEGKNYIQFDKLMLNKERYEMSSLVYVQHNLIKIEKETNRQIFIYGTDKNYYISKMNLTKFLQMDFLEKK